MTIRNGYWNTYYTIKGLMHLLKYTPTIRHFDYVNDKNKIKKAIKIFSTERGIKLTQNRMLLYVKSPRLSKV